MTSSEYRTLLKRGRRPHSLVFPGMLLVYSSDRFFVPRLSGRFCRCLLDTQFTHRSHDCQPLRAGHRTGPITRWIGQHPRCPSPRSYVLFPCGADGAWLWEDLDMDQGFLRKERCIYFDLGLSLGSLRSSCQVGNDVVQLLQDAFDRKHMHVKCIALVNDVRRFFWLFCMAYLTCQRFFR
jgi:hypothetical protein